MTRAASQRPNGYPRGLREPPRGADGQTSAGLMPRSGEAQGWAGAHTDDWPQATDPTHSAQRLTKCHDATTSTRACRRRRAGQALTEKR
jgi:hypothetical protein